MGQSFFSSSVEETSHTMRPFVALSFVLACAMGAPTLPLGAVGYTGAVGAVAGLATHGGVTQSVGAAPLATHPLQAGPVVPHPVNYVAPAAPAPYTTTHTHTHTHTGTH